MRKELQNALEPTQKAVTLDSSVPILSAAHLTLLLAALGEAL